MITTLKSDARKEIRETLKARLPKWQMEAVVISSEVEPEKRLLVSVIRQAVEDAWGFEPKRREESRRWLLSKSEQPFAFKWCLEMLDIEYQPEAILSLVQENRHFSEEFIL